VGLVLIRDVRDNCFAGRQWAGEEPGSGTARCNDGGIATIAPEAARLWSHCRSISAAVLSLALLVLCASGNAAELTGSVVRVTDGDTITVLDDALVAHKVRLSGIDAPEKKQPFGTRATTHLSALVYGKAVRVLWHKRDRYRRIVGRVLVIAAQCLSAACANGLDAGLEQVAAGYAWYYKQYRYEQTPDQRIEYASAELHAQAQRQGLWSESDPTPPWEFRRRHRMQREMRKVKADRQEP
jgi:endonuclease YncB( thermonuclease family)